MPASRELQVDLEGLLAERERLQTAWLELSESLEENPHARALRMAFKRARSPSHLRHVCATEPYFGEQSLGHVTRDVAHH